MSTEPATLTSKSTSVDSKGLALREYSSGYAVSRWSDSKRIGPLQVQGNSQKRKAAAYSAALQISQNYPSLILSEGQQGSSAIL
jgi:hypothetical protein